MERFNEGCLDERTICLNIFNTSAFATLLLKVVGCSPGSCKFVARITIIRRDFPSCYLALSKSIFVTIL